MFFSVTSICVFTVNSVSGKFIHGRAAFCNQLPVSYLNLRFGGCKRKTPPTPLTPPPPPK